MLRKILICLALSASALAQARLGELKAGDAGVRGAVTVIPGGAIVMSGAQIAAGANAASLKLDRGGELRVCSGSNVTITSDASGRDLMVALGGGSLETHYTLPANSDSLMTPDFRILLPGPGDFHLAINVNQRGDTCVQSLAGNSASVIVTELMGDASYQVRTGESVLFHAGHIDGATPSTAVCGCPPPVEAKKELGFPEETSTQAAVAISTGQPPPQTDPIVPESELKTGQPGTVVDAPFVFHGEEAPPPPPPEATRKTLEPANLPGFLLPKPLPPPKPQHKRHWFQKIFGGLFG